MVRARGLVGVVVVTVAGCSSSSSSPTACNTLVDDGPDVMFMRNSGTPVALTGGTIADGTYELSALTLYGGSPAPTGTLSAVFEFSGNTIQQVGNVNGVESRYTSTYTTSGTSITTTDSCPVAKTETHSYTATATQLFVVDVTVTGTLQQTFSKR